MDKQKTVIAIVELGAFLILCLFTNAAINLWAADREAVSGPIPPAKARYVVVAKSLIPRAIMSVDRGPLGMQLMQAMPLPNLDAKFYLVIADTQMHGFAWQKVSAEVFYRFPVGSGYPLEMNYVDTVPPGERK